jgi:acyl transferase domain-containing protein
LEVDAKRGSAEPSSFYAEAANLYLAGFDLDWEALCHGVDLRRVSLPTYAFERRRYWVDDAVAERAVARGPVARGPVARGPVAKGAAVAPALPAGNTVERGAAPAPPEVEGALQTVMVQQLQMVSRILNEQLAFIDRDTPAV